jgi:hypothetical protein
MRDAYCKGPYTAELQYLDHAEDRVDYVWVFSLAVMWGNDSLIDEWTGRVCK